MEVTLLFITPLSSKPNLTIRDFYLMPKKPKIEKVVQRYLRAAVTIKRQEVHWVDPSRRIPVSEKPKRVWTLIQRGIEDSKDHPPKLPITPKHNDNAFLEDYMNDWNWHDGVLHYYSRVARDSVWILCEFI